ncbi:hypothetical protein [[Bacillus] enclensis]|uniref:hypothetical protein n=1 Tax=[Bacillus] enclensis TaxID=1402860 RepID=UPI0018DD0B75|nr:hypothetical protein [[Bacillus] enclensis]MBH9968473.1 hypothetical protein [[Bacillus] enclensis]
MFSKRKIIKAAKPYKKKWTERIEVSRHKADYDGSHYYYVLFLNIWGNPQGALAVRTDGVVADLDTAKAIIWKISSYNNIMRFASKELKDNIKRPVGVMKTIEKQMLDFYGEDLHKHKLGKEIALLLNMCRTIYRNRYSLVGILKEMISISDTQESKKVLGYDTFEQLQHLFIDAHALMFQENKMQLENYKDLPKILADLNGHPKGKKLSKSLKHFHQEKIRQQLIKFDSGVVRKEIGDVSVLSYTAEDVEYFKELKRNEGLLRFESNLVPDIRN